MKVALEYKSGFPLAATGDKQNSLENKISLYHIALFLVALPFDRFYSQLILVSLLIHALIHINKQKLRLILSPKNLVLSAVLLLGVAGMAWSDEKTQALKEIQRQSAIILFPIVFTATGLDLALYKKKLLTIFGFTCALAILFLFAHAFKIILYNNLPLKSLISPFFINHNFSELIGLHATYLSLYSALSIAAFISFFTSEKNKLTRFSYATAIAILLAGLLQLGSKSVLIAIFIVLFITFMFFTSSKALRIRFIIVTLVIVTVAFFTITRFDIFKERYITGFKDDLTRTARNGEVADSRIMRWGCALTLIKQAPVAGHGTGSERKLLKEKYFEKKLYNSYLHELNAHNQYLSFLIKTGFVGLIVFIGTLCIGFMVAWQNRDFIFLSFMILISLVSLSENILDVNKGIFFYAFFFTYFMLSAKPLNNVIRRRKKLN